MQVDWAVWWAAVLPRLGDLRRARTLMRVLQALASHRGRGWSAALGDGLRQAAGDLVGREGVSSDDLLAGEYAVCAERCRPHSMVLIAQDTTAFGWPRRRRVPGLGQLGDSRGGQGLWAHSALVFSLDGRVLGLLAVLFWCRVGRHAVGHKQRLYQDKESYKWERCRQAALARLPEGVGAVFISDRESDVYEYFLAPRPERVELLVRLVRPRRLEDGGGQDVLTAAALAPQVGEVTVWVPRQGEQPGRQVRLRLQCGPVTLAPPQRIPVAQRQSVRAWVVQAVEVDPPQGAKPLRWVLLSTQRVEHLREAAEAVRRYGLRWQIEVLHKTVKSDGLQVERYQHRTGATLQRALAVALGAAVEVLVLVQRAREEPDTPAQAVFRVDALEVLGRTTRRPVATLRQAVEAVAVLGGWPGHPRSPQPGAKTVGRGVHDLQLLVAGWRAACGTPQGSIYNNDPS